MSKEVMEKWAVLSRRIQDSLSGVDVVKIFSAEEVEKAAKLLGSSDFINMLDEKMEVIAGET